MRDAIQGALALYILGQGFVTDAWAAIGVLPFISLRPEPKQSCAGINIPIQ